MQVEDLVYFILQNEISYTDNGYFYQCEPIIGACNVYKENTGHDSYTSWYQPVCYLFNAYLNTRFDLTIDLEAMRYSSKMSLEMLVEKMIATENKFTLIKDNLSSVTHGANLIVTYFKLFDLLLANLRDQFPGHEKSHDYVLNHVHNLQSEIYKASSNGCSENGQLVMLLAMFYHSALDHYITNSYNFIDNLYITNNISEILVEYTKRESSVKSIAAHKAGFPQHLSYLIDVYAREQNMHHVINNYAGIILSAADVGGDVFVRLQDMICFIVLIKDILTAEFLNSTSFELQVYRSASVILDFIKNSKRAKQPTLAELKYEIDVLFSLTEYVFGAALQLVMRLKLAREKLYVDLMCQDLDADGLRAYSAFITSKVTDKRLFPRMSQIDNSIIRAHDHKLFSYAMVKAEQLSWIEQRQVSFDEFGSDHHLKYPAI